MDCGGVPALRRAPRILAAGDFSGSALVQAGPQAGEVRIEGALMGEMRRAIAREEQERRAQDRFTSTLVIAASIIAAVRLARDDISRPSPRMTSVIADSVQLARMILDKVVH